MIYQENVLTCDIYNQIRNSVGWSSFSNRQANNAIENSYNIVAFDDDKAVGMGRLVGDGIYYTIVGVAVDPQYWHRGIGQMIVKKLLDQANNNLFKNERCTINLVVVQDKEEFYTKLGFKKISDENCGSGMKLTFKK